MKMLLFSGKAESFDREPIYCYEKTDIDEKEVVFKDYPLSLLKVKIFKNAIIINENRYEFQTLPITLTLAGKHITKYRDIVEERIEIAVEITDINSEVRL